QCLSALAISVSLVSAASAADNLLVNGSFETGPAVGAQGFVDLAGGSTAITGWTVGDFHVDYTSAITWNCSDGVRSVDLDGSVAPQPRWGSISQSFATTPGTAYVVHFDLSGNSSGLPLVKQVEVSAGNAVQTFSHDVGAIVPYVPPLALAWDAHSFTFTATATTSTLKFKSLTPLSGSAPGYGAVIDHVVVQAADATWTNLGFALSGSFGAPLLAGTGPLVAGSPGMLALSGAAHAQPALLFIALNGVPTPFKCGTLAAAPALAMLALTTSPAGAIPLAWAAWPAGLSGLSLDFQYAVHDTGAVCGASLSNALRAHVP
ncbi:MAG TPA: choice-of-anchor C family protein, partial [Planctomycetota bacterium]|nr:choice-of-anchor C family protein [Planctomycetota bacterium]